MHASQIRLDDVMTTSQRLGALLKIFRSGRVPTEDQFRSKRELDCFVLLLTRSEAVGPFAIQFREDQCAWFSAKGYDLPDERRCAERNFIVRPEEWDSDHERKRPSYPDMRFELEELIARSSKRRRTNPLVSSTISRPTTPRSRFDLLRRQFLTRQEQHPVMTVRPTK